MLNIVPRPSLAVVTRRHCWARSQSLFRPHVLGRCYQVLHPQASLQRSTGRLFKYACTTFSPISSTLTPMQAASGCLLGIAIVVAFVRVIASASPQREAPRCGDCAFGDYDLQCQVFLSVLLSTPTQVAEKVDVVLVVCLPCSHSQCSHIRFRGFHLV